MKSLIIQGSARKDGETGKVVSLLKKHSNWDSIDLLDYTISGYDYEHKNKEDNFIPLLRKIVNNYDLIILATPVYWYSMSSNMKVFIDRFSDLLTIEKDLGRSLKGKSLAVISSSNGNNLGNEFWLPFKETAKYLGMHYKGGYHAIIDTLDYKELKEFIEQVNKN